MTSATPVLCQKKNFNPKFQAVKFSKVEDYPTVKRGYIQNKSGIEYVFVSDSLPRSMDCKFCYVLDNISGRTVLQLGDWIVTNMKSGKTKIYSDKNFHEKFQIFGRVAEEIKDSEHNK